MDITQTNTNGNARAYRGIFEQYVIEAAFLWLLRNIGIDQPHYYLADIAELEGRLDAQLDGLMSSVDIGWEACLDALALNEPGEVFTAMVVAMRSHDTAKIQVAVEQGLASPRAMPGLISALGWLPEEVVKPWIARFLNGKDMWHKYLGVAACSVRRMNPGELLAAILEREDCRAHPELYRRALRLIGELRRQDLMPVLRRALANNDSDIQFWASWSSVLLGEISEVKRLKKIAMRRGPHQQAAIDLAFRVLGVEQGREWISAMSQDKAQVRAVIRATGILGDPHAVNWLIEKMRDPLLARLAGEAFSQITGIDLERHQLNRAAPADQETIPNDDANDAHVGLDEDENLPWPDHDKVAALWRNHGSNFLVGRRYFLGKPIMVELLQKKLQDGNMRQRHAAALELALTDPNSSLINTRARVSA